MRKSFAEYLNPWSSRREKAEQQRLNDLRKRDGDDCRRCRRPIRFDLPSGHDRAPTIQQLMAKAKDAAITLDDLCLCHGRCNREPGDSTPQVNARRRLRRVDEPGALPFG